MQRYLKILFFFFVILFFSGPLEMYPSGRTQVLSAPVHTFVSSQAPVKGEVRSVSDHYWFLESECVPSTAHSCVPSTRLKRILAFKMLNFLKSFVRDISFWENALTQHFQHIYTTSATYSVELISRYYVFAFRQIII